MCRELGVGGQSWRRGEGQEPGEYGLQGGSTSQPKQPFLPTQPKLEVMTWCSPVSAQSGVTGDISSRRGHYFAAQKSLCTITLYLELIKMTILYQGYENDGI